MDRGFKDQVALVQTGLLGQSYAMLSGVGRHNLYSWLARTYPMPRILETF